MTNNPTTVDEVVIMSQTKKGSQTESSRLAVEDRICVLKDIITDENGQIDESLLFDSLMQPYYDQLAQFFSEIHDREEPVSRIRCIVKKGRKYHKITFVVFGPNDNEPVNYEYDAELEVIE